MPGTHRYCIVAPAFALLYSVGSNFCKLLMKDRCEVNDKPGIPAILARRQADHLAGYDRCLQQFLHARPVDLILHAMPHRSEIDCASDRSNKSERSEQNDLVSSCISREVRPLQQH